MTTPFTLDVPESTLEDLFERLSRTRWPAQVAATPWAEGTDLGFMRALVDHWMNRFDWRAQERSINVLGHFQATIGETRIHFVRVDGRGSRRTPLLLCHGWPSSFLEYRKIIPLLTDPGAHGGDPAHAFDVIIPSLPGYGLSPAPLRPGTHLGAIAQLYDQLMTGVLGFRRYCAHGSDIGAGVVSRIGLDSPRRLIGIHLASVAGSSLVRHLEEGAPPLTDAERTFLDEVAAWSDLEGAYAHLHRTKPQTVTYGLHDSPVGLAAWLIEKYRAWSDCGGDVTSRFSLDELLTTITLYWVTGSIGPSMRLYHEGRLNPRELGAGERVEVPCAVALFPRDIARPPREWGERAYRISRWTEMLRGGHFPAHEEPDLLAKDLYAFFGELLAG